MPAVKFRVPPAMRMESLASTALETAVTAYVPPVIFRSSLQTMPLSVELTVSTAVPLSTRSHLEKITPSVLTPPSAVNGPATARLLSAAVVINTLSADFT